MRVWVQGPSSLLKIEYDRLEVCLFSFYRAYENIALQQTLICSCSTSARPTNGTRKLLQEHPCCHHQALWWQKFWELGTPSEQLHCLISRGYVQSWPSLCLRVMLWRVLWYRPDHTVRDIGILLSSVLKRLLPAVFVPGACSNYVACTSQNLTACCSAGRKCWEEHSPPFHLQAPG